MTKQTLRVAAVQMQAVLGDVDANLAQAERLVRGAFDQGARWVVLPEFFTSAMAFHPTMLDAARPLDGEPTQLLLRLAREHGGVVGGSFIALRGGQAYNTFVLALPDGSVSFHDKDQPTQWENCYYVGGDDEGLLDTPAGTVGAALCWELIRTRTVRRLQGRVGFVVAGACWWSLPDAAPPDHPLRAQNLALLRAAPVTFARMLGVPVVLSSHAGVFEGYRPPDETALQKRRHLGETQIVDGHGEVLARMSRSDGQGVVVAEITPGAVGGPRVPIPDGFWIPDLPQPFLRAWEDLNRHGQEYYQSTTLPYREPR